MENESSGLPTVSVVVSHFNSARTIGKCITHIIEQDYPHESYDITVVDAGSNDGSVEIVESLESPRLRQLVVPGCSESNGQSIGVDSTKGEIIMFTNSDVYVPTDWIRRHVSWLNAGYSIVGGKVFWGGDKYSLTWNMPTPSRPMYIQQQGLGLGFSNCSFRRSTFVSVGGLKNLKSQHDTEFAFRVVRRGGKMILDPLLEVYHDHPFHSVHHSFERSLGYARNHVLVMKAVYGRIVTGSGQPAMVSIATLIKEWTAINGVRTYRECRHKAAQNHIRVGLLEFVFIRLLSTKLGQNIGVFIGAIKRNVTMDTVTDLHKRVEGTASVASLPVSRQVTNGQLELGEPGLQATYAQQDQ